MNKRDEFIAVYMGEHSGDAVWATAPSYELVCSSVPNSYPVEKGVVQFAWNERGLYVVAKLADSCMVAQNLRDEQLHNQFGDVFELFVKPLNDSYYWEMYATPNGNKSTLFFPRERKGMTTVDFLNVHTFRGLEVHVMKRPDGWDAELFIPVGQLNAFGASWGVCSTWTAFCGRYNYSNEAITDPELSMTPPLSEVNYHLTEEYAEIRFLPSKAIG